MSKLPTPPRLPAPKSLSKRAVEAAEHDRLLRLVWGVLDELTFAMYATAARKTATDGVEEAREHHQRLSRAIDEAKDWAGSCKDPDLGEALKSAAKQLAFAKKAGVPHLPPELYEPEIRKRRLAAPISSDPVFMSGKTVGYIDVEVELAVGKAVSLNLGIPHFLSIRDDETQEQRDRRREQIDADDVRSYGPKAPSWSNFMEERRLWIDVRPQLGAIGQLLRELKVLREYAPFPTDILVVFAEDDKEAAQMLTNEGFHAATERVLRKLAGTKA